MRLTYTELHAETRGGTASAAIREAARRIGAGILRALEFRAEEVEEGGDGDLARRIRNIADWARKASGMVIDDVPSTLSLVGEGVPGGRLVP